jgi:peptidoglycan/xylan/chitin deacetylase (PgdA/CDA1 family)
MTTPRASSQPGKSKSWPFWDSLFYPSLRSVPGEKAALFLTFDDGPDPACTPRILDLLKIRGAKATFFLIAAKAQAHPELTRRIRNEGHAIGNHSFDHRYAAFFAGRGAMLQWIEVSDRVLRSMELDPVGFRPPAGVRTPELHASLMELNMPLILWRKRFFDTAWPWTLGRALGSLRTAKAGDIVLLHDVQRPGRLDGFSTTLTSYIDEAHLRGWRFLALTSAHCRVKVEI